MNLLRVGAIESTRNNVIRNGLILQLDASIDSSYPGSGTTWSNLISSEHNGILTNGPTYTEDNGGEIVFDGTNDNVVVIDNSETIFCASTTSYITIQTWVNITSFRNNVGGTSSLLSKQSLSFTSDGYQVNVTDTGQLRIFTNGRTFARTHSSIAGTLTIENWILVTAVIKIGPETDSVAAYVNKNKVISSSHGTDTYLEDNNLILGRGLQSDTGTQNYLYGKIGAFYFYNRRLSDSEIAENYEQTRARFGV